MAQVGYSTGRGGQWYPQTQFPTAVSTGASPYNPQPTQMSMWPPVTQLQQQQQQQQQLQQQMQMQQQMQLQQQMQQRQNPQELTANQMQQPMTPFGSMFTGAGGTAGPPQGGVMGQVGVCDCRMAPQSRGCCGDGPLDPYCCGPPTSQECSSCITTCCDWTFIAMVFFSVLTFAAFAIVLSLSDRDDLFRFFKVESISELESAIRLLIVTKPGACTPLKFFTVSFPICLESNLNAQMFVAQLASWNMEKLILYFLAMILTITATVYAIFVSSHRRKTIAATTGSLQQEQQQQPQQMSSESNTPKKGVTSEENIAPQSIITSFQGNTMPYFEVYGTPFYEFMRVAWSVMGVFVLIRVVFFMWSFCRYLAFYRSSSSGDLHKFWMAYGLRQTLTILCVSVYLAWPLVNALLECLLWILFILPWLVFRTVCKSGIGNLRPALPLDKMPCWIRLDMFFVDFGDIRRLGFSGPAWHLLTGSPKPYGACCCDDTAVDRDPSMAAFHRYRQEWFARMHGIYPMPMIPPPQSPGGPNGLIGPGTEAPPGAAAAKDETPRRRRSGHERHRSRSHRDEAGEGERGREREREREREGEDRGRARGQAGAAEEAPQRHHGASRRRHRRRDDSAQPYEGENGGESNGEERRHRHRRRTSSGGRQRGHGSHREAERPRTPGASGTSGDMRTVQVPIQAQVPGSSLDEGARSADLDKLLHEL